MAWKGLSGRTKAGKQAVAAVAGSGSVAQAGQLLAKPDLQHGVIGLPNGVESSAWAGRAGTWNGIHARAAADLSLSLKFASKTKRRRGEAHFRTVELWAGPFQKVCGKVAGRDQN